MKRMISLILALSLILLTACAASDTPEAPDETTTGDTVQTTEKPQEPQWETAVYSFTEIAVEKRFTIPDGDVEYASYSYCLPQMVLENPDAVEPAERESAERNVTAFNAYMDELMASSVAYGTDMAEELEDFFSMEGASWTARDEVTSSVERTGQVVTVRCDCYYNGGGAHPNSFVVSHIFDLTLGQFIDPIQIGDDPEYFRALVAEMLTAKVEALGEDFTSGLWNDYKEVIARWNDTGVLFSKEGMTVIFSAYELGPYAMGPVIMLLTYEELAGAIGPGGLNHLGVDN